jgi:signal transduction histidine kinase
MRHLRGRRNRAGRWVLILAACVLGVLLLFINALNCFSYGRNLSSFNLARFGFSAFTALVYLSVGSLVWLFARQRGVAHLLLIFSLAMMVIFASETASGSVDPLFSASTGVSGVVALASFVVLLLIFPYNYLEALSTQERTKGGRKARYKRLCIKVYIGGHMAFASFTLSYALMKNVLVINPPPWMNTAVNFYYSAALVCILLTITGAYCLTSTGTYCLAGDLRVRQQLSLFVVGVILAFTPLLLLTVLPLALNMSEQYVVDGRLSSLPLLLLPLALGYSILRYQVLVFDRYIRRAVAWAVGAIGLAMLCYLVVTLSRLAFVGSNLHLAQIISVTVSMAVLSPVMWWQAQVITDHLFFPEIRYYQRCMQRPEALARETFDLNQAAELLILATKQVFETQEVCLYVLDERTGYYHLAPTLEIMRGQMLWQPTGFLKLFGDGQADMLEMQHIVVQRLFAAPRPLFLHEALNNEGNDLVGLARYLMTAPYEETDPLLVPVRAQGRMIAILCLGERGDGQTYAGPDFEIIQLLLSHFSSVLETARLYVQASRHIAVLDALYSASARLERTYLSIQEVAVSYATVVAEALQGAAEIWLYMPERVVLHRVVHAGQGPSLLQTEWINQVQEQDWSAWFQEGVNEMSTPVRPKQMPSCLSHLPGEPFAWLPLCKGQRRMGVLILSFACPHVFSVAEKRILSMFARQCAAALENAQITIALRAAYERQKELDSLKDQFIMTASHELRTPLTSVQGYIELLSQYNNDLSAELRTEFIQKAHRSCDELALMVGNIMDAGRLQIEAEQIRLAPVDLLPAVRHVMEIMEPVTTREERQVKLTISPDLFVRADDLRLRQILLNLVSNALKYSPVGSPIQIQAVQGQGLVKISVRDYGLGVPFEEQGRLFERFKRLERDINSSVRGAGLGLYISRRLVEAMGGRLWIESSGVPGEGSIFAFILKRANLSPYSINETSPLLTRRV